LIISAALVVPQLRRDPETSNPVEIATPAPNTADLPPDFFCSDPALLKATPYPIVERIVNDANQAPLEGAPYFIALQDGRYAFGHSDTQGNTRTLFTSTSMTHQIYWYDDALAQWNATHAKKLGPRPHP
jgi:hypothetical protein